MEVVGEVDKISSEDSSSSRFQAVGEQTHTVTLTTLAGFVVIIKKADISNRNTFF